MAEAIPPSIDITADDIIDKTTVLYGASGSGKSAIIKHLLSLLEKKVEQILVVCPTDKQNKTYSGGMVSPALVHTKLTEDLLIENWKRQEMFASVYKNANKPEVLYSFFNRIPGINEVHRKIGNILLPYRVCVPLPSPRSRRVMKQALLTK